MDSVQARAFSEQLIEEKMIDEWQVIDSLGNGKSAVVMRAKVESSEVALKVFHPELIERFGLPAQVIRIDREKMLIGLPHPNLVNILGGGVSKTGNHPYVVMDLVPGKLLGEALEDVPRANIAALIEQLARAAKHLEDNGVVHRDIKPDNIKLVDSSMSKIKLLDFGVIRPIGDSTATDQPGHKPFVGTHQYSSPEMLHRMEEDTVEGWRAITFYQIGAVLHDLIMRKRIFDEHREPYANLVVAIDTIIPTINALDVDSVLISLARKCLLKNPKERAQLVQWSDFFFSEQTSLNSISERKAKLINIQSLVMFENDLQPLLKIESNRLCSNQHQEFCLIFRREVESLLDAFSECLPPRTIQLLGGAYPEVTLFCKFAIDSQKNILSPFHFQFSFIKEFESSVVTIYARAGIGEFSHEVGWTQIGSFLSDLSDLQPELESWVMDILEQLSSK